MDELRCDKFWAKYYKQAEAYDLIQEYFLQEKQYEYLIICPDDLLVKPYDFQQLIYDIHEYNYPVISGYCNIDIQNKTTYAITPRNKMPHLEHGIRKYHFIKEGSHYLKARKPFEVGFNGFTLCAIRRDVLDKIHIHDDTHLCCNDVVFANQCREAGIPLMCDPKIKMLHVKRHDGYYDEYYVGQREPFMYLQEV